MLRQLEVITESLRDFYPEAGLAGLFILIILFDLVIKNKSHKVLPYFTLAGLLITFFLLIHQFTASSIHEGGQFLFFKFLHLNQYEIIFKIFFHICTFILIWLMLIYPNKESEKIRGEFYSLLIAMLLGLHLMVMATNMLMLYISIELISISSYILTTFAFDKKSSESGMKYVLFGAFSSGLMLYGMSLLYGFTGSIQFFEPEFLKNLELGNHWLATGAGLLVLAGFLFKIAAVPFHLWAPDVYEGAPTPLVAFFSIAPKAAGIAALMNFTYPFYYNIAQISPIDWKLVLGIVSIATLTIGNLAALGQNNVKRLLAYSSIAHAGFILIAVLAFSKLGVWSVMFYLSIYLPMNFAAFAMVGYLANQINSEDVRNFKGLGVKLPFAGVIFVILMVALTGLPPTAGFNAKFLAFSALWETYQESGEKILLWAFIAGLLNTVIALFYYLKIPYYMFFKKAENNIEIKLNTSANLFFLLMTIPMLVFFFKPDLLMDFIQKIILNF